MSKEMTVIVLGIFVVVAPYLGIPGEWRTALLVMAGLAIAVIGFLLRGEALSRGTHAGDSAPFADSHRPHEHTSQGITSLN